MSVVDPENDSLSSNRADDEPAKWHARYELFRSLGPNRSLLAAYNAEREKARKSPTASVPSSWKEAADRWRWKERATAWDDEQVRLAREAEKEELAARRREWIEQATELQWKGRERLKNMDGGDLTPKEVLEYLREGVKLEMLARGQPTDITRADVNNVTDQIADLERSFAGAADRAGEGRLRGDGPPQPVDTGSGEGGPDDEAG